MQPERRGGQRGKLHWEYGLAYLWKCRMSGAYSESQASRFQNNWSETKVSKKSVSIASFTSTWLLWWGPREPHSKLTLKGTGLAQPEPFDCVARLLPCSHSDYSPQSALSRQRSSGSALKTAWSTATPCAVYPSLQRPPISPFCPPLRASWAKHLETRQALQWISQCYTDSCHPASLFHPKQLLCDFHFPFCAFPGPCVAILWRTPWRTGQRERPSFLRRGLNT